MLTLGEGNTPLLEVRTLAKQLEINKLFIKDESLNPTGSFKARGLCLAVSRAKELGYSKCFHFNGRKCRRLLPKLLFKNRNYLAHIYI